MRQFAVIGCRYVDLAQAIEPIICLQRCGSMARTMSLVTTLLGSDHLRAAFKHRFISLPKIL
jgi:hypothetical protein